ncbi:hypothetical protein RCG19_12065 [Neobacillus sp. OS1-2]|uniref:hypothetical protein n=1 Tax=Neobacillus sp. OS1-2 TaxID=3070680 RepID=UPI0027E0E011|nr:hypothetical protein [Neobacillus sp. OS1-2]WML37983.1 hypothetical protein RCG19_12065 [Neobacillus sp. OS1-2]
MKCRGNVNRERIISEYELRAVAHVKLLIGQTKKSCTGDILTDSYYCFTYKNKNVQTKGSFFCGTHAANHFLTLLGKQPLPLFNPLRSSIGSSGQQSVSTTHKSKWDPAAKELYNAINLLIIVWNTNINSILADIRDNLEKYPSRTPFISKIKALNTIISKDFKGRTLQVMISELRKNNPELRSFSFSHLDLILSSEGVSSYFN